RRRDNTINRDADREHPSRGARATSNQKRLPGGRKSDKSVAQKRDSKDAETQTVVMQISIRLYGYLRRRSAAFATHRPRPRNMLNVRKLSLIPRLPHILSLSASLEWANNPGAEYSHVDFRVRISARTSFARSILTLRSFTRISATRSISSPTAPTVAATFRAWSAMCPFWIPSVASARTAAKFCARHTAAMTSASSWADF